MPGNPGRNISVRYKVESTFGTAVSGGSGEELRIHPGGKLNYTRDLIEDPEVRDDGMTSTPRLGPAKVEGRYPGTLSLGTFNTWIAALFRNAVTADVTATYNNGAALTSLQVTGTNTLVSVGTTTFLASGARVGDVFRLGSMSTAANNDVNCVISAISADGLTITTLGSPLTIQGADNACTFTIKKKFKNSTTLTRYSYTIEEYLTDLDESERFVGCRIVSMKLTFAPKGVVTVEFGIKGQTMSIIGTASAPNFTSPTEYTSIGLVVQDASLYIAGTSIATITGGEIMFDIGGEGIECVGTPNTPDIYEDPMRITGQITAVRTALTASHLARFLAETDNVEMSLMFVEPDAAVPIDFFHVFLPRVKYMGDTANLGQPGPITETIPIFASIKATTTGYDSVMATISTSV